MFGRPQEDMKLLLILSTFSLVVVITECLKCRSENDGRTIDEYEDIVRSCLRMEEDQNGHRNRWKGNRNNNYGDHNSQKGHYGSDEDDDDDDEDDDNHGNNSNHDSGNNKRKEQNRGGHGHNHGSGNDRRRKNQRDKYNGDDDDDEESSWPDQNSKNRHSGSSNSRDRTYFSQRDKDDKNQGQRGGQKFDSGYNPSSHHNYFSSGNNGNNYNNSNRQHGSSPLEDVEPCIIHCMFRQMKMVNENSHVDKASVINTLTRRIRDPELKEFIQDSIHECFENLDRDSGQCETTKIFAMCLEEKGRRVICAIYTNCEDWTLNSSRAGQGNRNNGRDNMNYYFQSSPSRG